MSTRVMPVIAQSPPLPHGGVKAPRAFPLALWLIVIGAVGLPITLLWDFSWESTIGVDLFWAPPHFTGYLMVILAALGAIGLLLLPGSGAPLGAWGVIWGSFAFATALVFDRWWQGAYGLGAGIWHPPQLLKATAVAAIVAGAWVTCLKYSNNSSGSGWALTICNGAALVLITTFTITWNYPNRQHSKEFYFITCSAYPLVLAAIAKQPHMKWAATTASLFYMGVICGLIWILPLFAAKPQSGPIYNNLESLMPPPFPLLLALPAVSFDWLAKTPRGLSSFWLRSAVMGVAFLLLFSSVQWVFAEFLLTDLAENWFFAGGGKHWPFFLKIDAVAKVSFWTGAKESIDAQSWLLILGIAILAIWCGLWCGAWMRRLQK